MFFFRLPNSLAREKAGLLDLFEGFRNIKLALYLAYSDIRQRYRRSSLGPFWITISTGIMIGSIGVIFGKLFKSPMNEFFPYLAVGLILWSFISSVINSSTSVFVNSEAIIKQLPISLFTHVLRLVSREFIVFCHNVLILPVVFFFVGRQLNIAVFFAIPGLIILIINLLWICLLLGIICTRFRDMAQIVSSILQVLFYVTPIIWLPKLLPARADLMLLAPNPLFHLIDIVRAPLMGTIPSLFSWSYSLLLACFGWMVTITFYNTYRNRIAYWL